MREVLRCVQDLAQLDFWARDEVAHGREQLLVIRDERAVVDVAPGEEEKLARDLRRAEHDPAKSHREEGEGLGW